MHAQSLHDNPPGQSTAHHAQLEKTPGVRESGLGRWEGGGVVLKRRKLFSWSDAPADVRNEVHELITSLSDALGNKLVGVYLHGSLAMGCFNPDRSDVDVLVVVRERMPTAPRRRIAEVLLTLSGNPAPIEISVLAWDDLHPWRHPTPFDLHYSEDWRESLTTALATMETMDEKFEVGAPRVDADLAGHITVVRSRGVVLHGPPPTDVFPAVPRTDYLDSVGGDICGGLERIHAEPVYAILNACRTLGYLADGMIRSKDEGGAWALTHLPDEHRSVVSQALATYRSEAPASFEKSVLNAWVRFVASALAQSGILIDVGHEPCVRDPEPFSASC